MHVGPAQVQCGAADQHAGIGKPTLLVEHRQTIDEQLELRPVVEQHAVGDSMRMSANHQVLQMMQFDQRSPSVTGHANYRKAKAAPDEREEEDACP